MGKAGEILVSNQFVRYQSPTGEWVTGCLLSEPVPLTKGKAVPMIVAAARQTWQSLRTLGASGCVVEHYVWDRAGIDSLERHCRAFDQAQLLPVHQKYSKETMSDMEFVVVTPCALHDSQNSFRWGFLEQVSNRALMRDVYVAVESLRNSADLITSRISTWVSARLQFVEPRSAEWKDEQRALWEALDVEAGVADLMVFELELVWDDGRLCVRSGAQVVQTFQRRHMHKFKLKHHLIGVLSSIGRGVGFSFYDVEVGEQDLLESITAVLLSCWRFKKWTESRWLTVGTSLRVLICAVLQGLDDFYKFLKQDSVVSVS